MFIQPTLRSKAAPEISKGCLTQWLDSLSNGLLMPFNGALNARAFLIECQSRG